MPLVFTENEATESGIHYADRTGVSYQFPKMYRGLIKPGERFVYYRGRYRKDGGRSPQVYFGTGVVGMVRADDDSSGRFSCEVLDYSPFERPVLFKTPSDSYFESGGVVRGYFQRGVRRVSEVDYRRILEAADGLNAALGEAGKNESGGRQSYASAEVARQIETFSVGVAVQEIQRRFPKADVDVLPRNNPGFDLLVRLTPDSTLFVEVKGTGQKRPCFFASEGELLFSRRNADRYRLVVVYAIDLNDHSCSILWREGGITAEVGFELTPIQWACRALADPSSIRTVPFGRNGSG
jgi:hypothetical protein